MNIKFFISVSLLLSAIFAGCSTTGRQSIIKSGDNVLIDCTCRLKNGDIVITTNNEYAESETSKKAGIFLPLKDYKPTELIAGRGDRGPDYGRLKSFENKIFEELSLKIVGMKNKDRSVFELGAEDIKGLTEKERYLKIGYINEIPKTSKIHPKLLEKIKGSPPLPGDIIIPKDINNISIKVISIDSNEATTEVIMKDGTTIDMPMGKGTVYDRDDHYESVLNVHEGQLIRSGVVIGRIIEIGPDKITIDYSNPFGGEKIFCDVETKGAAK